MPRRPAATFTFVLGVALLTVACTGEPTPSVDDPGPVHVHGLASDPDDPDTVLVATHTGLFAVRDGEAQRRGDGWHDLMGFTVAADGSYLASGHPDLTDDQLQIEGRPPHLGLARSTDRGTSWEPVSLLGEVDFHDLTLVGTRLVGADATNGRVLASDDAGRNWETLAEVALEWVVAHPGQPEVLVGSAKEQLLRSDDGGRTWSPLSGTAPGPLAATDAGFVTASSDGTVRTAIDGADWSPVGTLPGSVEALGTGPDVLYAAVAGHGIFRSDDHGRTWSVIYEQRR